MWSTGGQSDSSILPGGFILPGLTRQVISEAAALTLGSWLPGEPGAERSRCFDGREEGCKKPHAPKSDPDGK